MLPGCVRVLHAEEGSWESEIGGDPLRFLFQNGGLPGGQSCSLVAALIMAFWTLSRCTELVL